MRESSATRNLEVASVLKGVGPPLLLWRTGRGLMEERAEEDVRGVCCGGTTRCRGVGSWLDGHVSLPNRMDKGGEWCVRGREL